MDSNREEREAGQRPLEEDGDEGTENNGSPDQWSEAQANALGWVLWQGVNAALCPSRDEEDK